VSADTGQLRLAPESIEALAACLAELLGRPGQEAEPPAKGKKKMLSAAEVSELWGVSRRWVYDHAEALGALRLGSGPRPRLRFDPDGVAERLGAPRRSPAAGDRRRLTASARFPHSDSLSARHRAIVAESQIDTAGGRANAPGPAPKEMLRRSPKPSPAGLAPPPPSARTRGDDL
jgi:hypothetical protein